MVFGIGIDLIETDRVEHKISGEHGFREYVFSSSEIEYCEKQANRSEHYAARFAAKEALLKALGTGLPGKVILNETSVVHDEPGKPFFTFKGETETFISSQGFTNIQLSLTHLKSVAGAIVVIEK